MTSSISFSGVDTDLQGNTLVACHIHFPPLSKVVSFTSIQGDIFFKVPTEAQAVCATLVWRFGKGWVPHGRCRFSLTKETEQKEVKHESTLQVNGTATLTYGGVLKHGDAPVLLREWFFVPPEHNDWLATALADCQQWYVGKKQREPVDMSIDKVHMPFWNNMYDSVPGWFFAFDLPRGVHTHPGTLQRFSSGEWKEVVDIVKSSVLGLTTSAGLVGDLPDTPILMALSISVFSMSISYEQDFHHNSGGIIERFSSNGRFDGIGDCEDIAKEACMAHAELVALPDEKFKNRGREALKMDMVMCSVKKSARLHQAVMVLGTVQRPTSAEVQAHAFCMLLPKEFLKYDVKGAQTGDGTTHTFLCDGTYACYPSANAPAGWGRPYEYKYAISGIIMGQGEVFFHYINKPGTYGVHFSDIFPCVAQNVTWTSTHPSNMTSACHDMARSIMVSNMPIQGKTFTFEAQSPASRFLNVWSHRSGDLKLFRDFGGASVDNGYVDCANLQSPNHKALEEANASYMEVAYVGDRITQQGSYGTVRRPYESGRVAGHTHHREDGHGFRTFNPPTPADLVVFIVHRVCSKLAWRGTSPEDIRQKETVFTHNNLYEVTDTGDAHGIVSTLLTKYRLKNLNPDEEQVGSDANALFIQRGFGQGVGSALSKMVKHEMFEKEADEAAYIDFLETTGDIGIRVRRIPTTVIEARCVL